jgi:HK97 family phage prohead protease
MVKRYSGETVRPEFKTFELKLDDAEQGNGIIRGFASTFGNIDLGDDIVEKGAFKKTLRESKGVVPILDSHNPDKQIGWNIRAEETEKGLYVEGQLDLNVQAAREKFSLAKKAVELGAKMGLSIGYSVIKADPDKDRPRVRKIKEVKLFEYSIVTFPMNTEAMITAAKSFNKSDRISCEIKTLLEEGFSISEIESALRHASSMGEAAESEASDPLIEQSLDNMIKLLKKGA